VTTVHQPADRVVVWPGFTWPAGFWRLVPVLLLVDVAAGAGIGALAVSSSDGRTAGTYQAVFGFYAAASMVLATAAWASARAIDTMRRSERARLWRLVHDTALQSLEAMSLRCAADTVAPATELAELRAAARAEAARLRRALHASTGDSRGLRAGIDQVVDEATARGLRVELVTADLSAITVSPMRRDALTGATRAALNNVVRHAGVSAALIRVEVADRGVRVIVRDHGCGFPAADDRFGYGIRESIRGRLLDVGGRAEIAASPGRGTRVTLWVPAP
jgi:signal transduction histidine kinase